MTAITYNATLGFKLLGTEVGAWMNDTDGISDLTSNTNDLTETGTVTTAAVATGSELLAFSAFSSSNYFQRAYDADFDYGTGNFHWAGWVHVDATNTTINTVLERGAASGSQIRAAIQTDGTLDFVISDDNYATNDTISSTTAFDDGVPRFCVLQRNGSNLELFVGGVKNATDVAITNAAGSLSNGSAILRFGVERDGTNPFNEGFITQWRTGAFALSAAQIKTIYDSEKVMFLKNRVYTVVGTDYSIDIDYPQVLTRSASEDKVTQRAKGGQSNTLLFRSDGFWDITSHHVDRDDFDFLRRFLDSIADGQTFAMDPYGSVASADEAIAVEVDSNGYTENRSGPRLLSASFKVREI